MPTIRVDDQVYAWLQSRAKPFEDNPNSVLRRVAGLDIASKETPGSPNGKGPEEVAMPRSHGATDRLSARVLKERWKVDVPYALYHRDGMFYQNLKVFPGALFDLNGYVIFHTEKEYLGSPYLSIGRKLNVHDGIWKIPGYKRMR
ncbi:MAG: hypothetical protein HY672_02600 [Chloroflexi bacterium]|nr:hypothetical protein [Chloroflexota bacterium]